MHLFSSQANLELICLICLLFVSLLKINKCMYIKIKHRRVDSWPDVGCISWLISWEEFTPPLSPHHRQVNSAPDRSCPPGSAPAQLVTEWSGRADCEPQGGSAGERQQQGLRGRSGGMCVFGYCCCRHGKQASRALISEHTQRSQLDRCKRLFTMKDGKRNTTVANAIVRGECY